MDLTAHELARQLLAGPDCPVVLSVGNPKDTWVSDTGVNLTITVETEEANAMVDRAAEQLARFCVGHPLSA